MYLYIQNHKNFIIVNIENEKWERWKNGKLKTGNDGGDGQATGDGEFFLWAGQQQQCSFFYWIRRSTTQSLNDSVWLDDS